MVASYSCITGGGPLVTGAAATVLTEISTIVLHIRFYMIKYKKADGMMFLAVMITFVSFFFWSRCWVLPHVGYTMIKIPIDNPKIRETIALPILLLADAMMVAIQLLNVLWGYLILKGVHKVMNKGLGEAKAGTRDAELPAKVKNVK